MILLKRLILLIIITSTICCGCSNQDKTTTSLNNISFTANITYNDSNYICDVTLNNSDFKLIVNQPHEIKGYTIKSENDNITAEFMGISYHPELSDLPHGAVLKILLNIFDDASKKSVSSGGENCEITGKVNQYKYNFIFSPSGLPKTLECENLSLKIEFYDVVIT